MLDKPKRSDMLENLQIRMPSIFNVSRRQGFGLLGRDNNPKPISNQN